MKSAVLALVSILVVSHAVMGQLTQQLILTEAACDFSLLLHVKIILNRNNGIFSPIGAHSSLTMTYLGARNETAKEMAEVLRLSSLPGAIPHETYRDIIKEFKSQDELTLGAAKSILVHPSSSIEQDFKNEVESKYLSIAVNFNLSAPGGAEKEVNDYTARKTQELIKNILPSGSLNNDASVVPVSAYVVNATWEEQFDKSKTQKQDFFKLDGSVSKVDMMKDTREVLLKRDNITGVDIAVLPFKGGRFHLYIIVSQKKDGITVESKLATLADPKDIFENLNLTYVELAIPRFKIDSHYELKEVLKDLGMVKAVTPGDADFSGISKSGKLHISAVHHRAMIDIQESGAVTREEPQEEDKPCRTREEASEQFIADSSFVFFLRDNKTKMIAMQGTFYG